MAAKMKLQQDLEAIFGDVSDGKTPSSAAKAMADAIDSYVDTVIKGMQATGIPIPPMSGGPVTIPPAGATRTM